MSILYMLRDILLDAQDTIEVYPHSKDLLIISDHVDGALQDLDEVIKTKLEVSDA